MTAIAQFLRHDSRLDRLAIALSGLCVAHCLVTAVLVALLASAGGALGAGWIHEAGLVIAIVLGIVALQQGFERHGRLRPVLVAGSGLSIMAAALFVPHGGAETVVTLIGVCLLAVGHQLNRRPR